MIRYRTFHTLPQDEQTLLLQMMDNPLHLKLWQKEAYETTYAVILHSSQESHAVRREVFLWVRALAGLPHLKLRSEYAHILSIYFGTADAPLIQGYQQET